MLSVRLSIGRRETPWLAGLVDSGADNSKFHVSIALDLGIDLSRCRTVPTIGATGAGRSYIHRVLMEVEDKQFAADVTFSESMPEYFAILGREDVFHQFRLGFDQRAAELLLDPY